MMSRYPFLPRRRTVKLSAYLFLIHLIPCNWGSIIKGRFTELVRIVPFSVDIWSAGKPSLFHWPMRASSAKSDRMLAPAWSNERGSFSGNLLKYGSHFLSNNSTLYCLVKHPKYEMNPAIIKTSPGNIFACSWNCCTLLAQRTFSELNPPTSRLANDIVLFVASASSWHLTFSSIAFW